jgi:hypothetical protein
MKCMVSKFRLPKEQRDLCKAAIENLVKCFVKWINLENYHDHKQKSPIIGAFCS